MSTLIVESIDLPVVTTVSPFGSSLMEWKHFISRNLPMLIARLSDSLESTVKDTTTCYFALLDGTPASEVQVRHYVGSLSYSDVLVVGKFVAHVRDLIGPAIFGEGSLQRTFLYVPKSGKPFIWTHHFFYVGIIH